MIQPYTSKPISFLKHSIYPQKSSSLNQLHQTRNQNNKTAQLRIANKSEKLMFLIAGKKALTASNYRSLQIFLEVMTASPD